MKTQFILHGWLRFFLANLRPGLLLLVLLSFSSLSYAVERGEYRHYMGFAISGGSFSDNLQEIGFASDNTDGSSNIDQSGISVVDSDFEEGGSLFVWDAFDLDNQAAFSLMYFSVVESLSETLSDGTIIDETRDVGGRLLAGKYFTQSGLYIGGGVASISLRGNTRIAVGSPILNRNKDLTSDNFLTPTLVLGYRGLVNRGEKSHFYLGVDWVMTSPTDVYYEVSGPGMTDSGTYKLTISMVAISCGWAW